MWLMDCALDGRVGQVFGLYSHRQGRENLRLQVTSKAVHGAHLLLERGKRWPKVSLLWILVREVECSYNYSTGMRRVLQELFI